MILNACDYLISKIRSSFFIDLISKKLVNKKGKNLYQFWGDSLTQCLANEIKIDKESCLINLASNEYSKVLKFKDLGIAVITPVFKDFKNGKLKVISFFAKKARGRMCRYIIKEFDITI